jgi:hypothetical protein
VKRTPMKQILILASLLLSAAAAAGEDQPASAPAGGGTTIIGDHDSAVGLYLTPWKNEYAADMDRPPSLYDEARTPIDRRAFHRQVQYDQGNAAWRRAQFQGGH